MARSDFYRLQARECLAASRACSDRSKAAQLTIIAAGYIDLAQVLDRIAAPPDHDQPKTRAR
jgi:hypothetical protein